MEQRKAQAERLVATSGPSEITFLFRVVAFLESEVIPEDPFGTLQAERETLLEEARRLGFRKNAEETWVERRESLVKKESP